MEIIDLYNIIARFDSKLDQNSSSRLIKSLEMLSHLGYKLDMPDSKSLGKGLFELRTLGKVQIRVLYIFHKNKIYLVHIFIKKAWRINFRDIDYARKIQNEIIRLV